MDGPTISGGGADGSLGSIFYTVEAKFDKLEEQLREFEERADKAIKVSFVANEESLRALNEALQAAVQPIRVTLDTSVAEQQLAALTGGASVAAGGAGGAIAAAEASAAAGGAASFDLAAMLAPFAGANAAGPNGSVARSAAAVEAEASSGASLSALEEAAVYERGAGAQIAASESMAVGAAAAGAGAATRRFGYVRGMAAIYLGMRGFEAAEKSWSDRSELGELMSRNDDQSLRENVAMLKREKSYLFGIPSFIRDLGTRYIDGGETSDQIIDQGEQTLRQDKINAQKARASGRFRSLEGNADLESESLESRAGELEALDKPSSIYRKIDDELQKEIDRIKAHVEKLKEANAAAAQGPKELAQGLSRIEALQARDLSAAGRIHNAATAHEHRVENEADARLHHIEEADAEAERVRLDAESSGLGFFEAQTRAMSQLRSGNRLGADVTRVDAQTQRELDALDPADPLHQRKAAAIFGRRDAQTAEARTNDTLRFIEGPRRMADLIEEEKLRAGGHDEQAHIAALRNDADRAVHEAQLRFGAGSLEAKQAHDLGIAKLDAEAQRFTHAERATQVDPFFTYLGGGQDSSADIKKAKAYLDRESGLHSDAHGAAGGTSRSDAADERKIDLLQQMTNYLQTIATGGVAAVAG